MYYMKSIQCVCTEKYDLRYEFGIEILGRLTLPCVMPGMNEDNEMKY